MGLSLLRGRRRKTAPCAEGHAGMRIADVLREPEEDGACSCDDGGGGKRGWKASSPIWVCARWAFSAQKAAALLGREPGDGRRPGCWVFLGGGRGCRVVEEGKGMGEDVGEAEGSSSCCSSSEFMGEMTELEVAVEREGEEGGVDRRSEECAAEREEALELQEKQSGGGSGRRPEEVPFALGLGVGLIFLLARSRSYLDKMIEMRSEVEAMLKEVKDAESKKNLTCESIESKNQPTLAGLGSCGDENSSPPWNNMTLVQNQSPSFDIDMTESPAERDDDSIGSAGYSQNLDRLQDEFESEIDLLQTGLDHNEYPPFNIEMTGEGSNISESSNASSEGDPRAEENEGQNADDSCEFGVCPRELERRLHELLQLRQQERIEELESALRDAEQKLHEKEMEIRWWRDTAQITSNRGNEEVSR